MGIEKYYTDQFILDSRTETKVNGKLKREYSTTDSYMGSVHQPSTQRVVRFEKQDFVITKLLYCSTDTPIKLGDRVTILNGSFDVVSTDNLRDHHYEIGLVSR